MIDVSSFRRDARAMRDGDWQSPGPEYGPLRLKTRALGHAYNDAVQAGLKQLARVYLSEDRIPSEERAKVQVEALIAHCLIDVEGLSEKGKTMPFARFLELIRDPSYGDLSNAAFIAAGLVGRSQSAATEDAVGNSPPASAPS